MNKDLIALLEYFQNDKGIPTEVLISAIEEAICIAAKKSLLGVSNVSVTMNPKTGYIEVLGEKEIVDVVEEAASEISLEDARVLDPECELGQYIDVPVETKGLGRISAHTAKQIIMQKFRGAERDVIYKEYRDRINKHEIVSGSVKRFVRGSNIILDLGKVEALLPTKEYPKTDHYNIGDKVRALLFEVRDLENGGAEVILSRSSPEFVKQLFALEVSEISDGTVSIENIVREAGYRTKLIVRSNDPKVDPVGACVGLRGARVKNIIRELNNEKIDIIAHSENRIALLQQILHPIEIRKHSNLDQGTVTIVVDDDHFAAAVGKRGLNVKLNGQLLGVQLEVHRMTAHNLELAEQRTQIAVDKDDSLDAPLINLKAHFTDDPITTLVIDILAEGGYDTTRSVRKASPEDLSKVEGISLDMANKFLQQIEEHRIEEQQIENQRG